MVKALKYRFSYKKIISKVEWYKQQVYSYKKIANSNNSYIQTTNLDNNKG